MRGMFKCRSCGVRTNCGACIEPGTKDGATLLMTCRKCAQAAKPLAEQAIQPLHEAATEIEALRAAQAQEADGIDVPAIVVSGRGAVARSQQGRREETADSLNTAPPEKPTTDHGPPTTGLKLVHFGYSNPTANAFVGRLAKAWGASYHWQGLKNDMHSAANAIKDAHIVVIWNGMQWMGPLCTRLCRERGIPTLYYEQGMLPQSETYFVDPRGLVGDSILNHDLSWVTQADMERLYAKRAELQGKFPLEPEADTVLAACQIHNDSQVLYYTPYNNMAEFVAQVEALYPDRKVLARSHPKSGNKNPSYARALPQKGGDFLDAARKASLVVSATSTTLYEAGILGVPVRALGNHPLRNQPPELHDKVLAGALALNLDRKTGDLKKVMDRFGMVPRGAD